MSLSYNNCQKFSLYATKLIPRLSNLANKKPKKNKKEGLARLRLEVRNADSSTRGYTPRNTNNQQFDSGIYVPKCWSRNLEMLCSPLHYHVCLMLIRGRHYEIREDLGEGLAQRCTSTILKVLYVWLEDKSRTIWVDAICLN